MELNTSILKNKKIVVTGGAGFIGSHIVDKLISLDAQVVVIDDLSTGRKENIAHCLDSIEFHQTSILDTQKISEYMKDAYAVVHQAALPSVPKSIELPMETHMANSTGTLSVFVAGHKAGVDRVIYASSSSVYGDTPILPKVETMPLDPLSPYAVQKLTTELHGKIFYSLYGLKTIGLRYFNVFGPRQNPDSAYAAVIPLFIKKIREHKSPSVFGDGEHTRDFTYVENVVHANICALLSQKGFGEAYNVAVGTHISLNTLIEKINAIMQTSIAPEYLPPRKGDIKDSFADIAKARTVIGYEPQVTFDEGLKKTVDSL